MDFNVKRIKVSEKTENSDFNNEIWKNCSKNKIAVEFHEENFIKNITYKEIENTKNKIKAILSTINVSQFIAIDLELKNFCLPSLILGILSTGRGFLITSPLSTRNLCSRLNVTYLFTQNSIPNTEVIQIVNCHGEDIQFVKLKDHLEDVFYKNRFAYAITTSGTTGNSKIVKVPQESIMHNIFDLRKRFAISENDKIGQLTPLTFDPSIVEIFLGLCCNCTLFMVSKNLQNKSRELLEIMNREKVTLFQTTPSLLFARFGKNDLKNGILGEKSNLRILLLGGEPFPKIDSLKTIRNERNQTRVFNIYGITEVSCWASIVEFNEQTENYISLGFLGDPLSETYFQVQTDEGKIITEGEGLLFIGSRKRICLIDEETSATSPVFRNSEDKVTIDKNGRVFYKGRNNKIIKRFGNKVDLSKLESNILNSKSVENCYAIWNEEEQKLHVCIKQVLNSNDENSLKFDVMNHLKSLPGFYQPDEIHLIDNLPLNKNGKICQQSLKELCSVNKNCDKLLMLSVESTFSNLWKLLVGSIKCGFIKSGGNSVAALQIVNSISEKFDQEFPELLAMLLNDNNYSNCLAYIEEELKKSEDNNRTNPCLEIFPSTSDGNFTKRKSVGEKNTKRENLIHCETELNDKCLWQKCRGFTNEENKTEEAIFIKKNVKLKIVKYYDLKKCVDASATIFQYSSGKVFATVGSHSGMIITVEIDSNSDECYIIQLPDRVESSILVFDHFHAVVGCYDGNVYYLNLKSGEIYWKFQTGDVVKCTAATCSEKRKIFIGSYDHHMYCLSLENGLELWRMKVEGSISGTARLHNETQSLLFGALNGTCVNLDQVSGNIRWRYSFSDPVFSAPAILETGNVIFASVSGKLVCLNIQFGQKLWTYTINGNIFSHLVSVNKRESILFASRNKNLYYLECNLRPNLKFSSMMGNPIITTPWNTDKFILIACIDGSLHVLDSNTGDIVTSYKLPGEVFSSPVLYRDLIIVGCRDNNLYILKLFTS